KQVAVPVEVPALVDQISVTGGYGTIGYGVGAGYGAGSSGITGHGSYGTIGYGYGTGSFGGGSGSLHARAAAVPTVTVAQPVTYSASLEKEILRPHVRRLVHSVL